MKKTIALLNITLQIILFSIFTTFWMYVAMAMDVKSGGGILAFIGGLLTSVLVNALLDEKVGEKDLAEQE